MNVKNNDISEMFDKAGQASSFLKQLANTSRLLILCHLTQRSLCVSELEEITLLSQSALSQHLAKLRKEGLVSTHKEKQHVYYDIEDANVKIILEALYKMFCGPEE